MERKRDFMRAIIAEAARHVKRCPLVDMRSLSATTFAHFTCNEVATWKELWSAPLNGMTARY